jgi:PAS domain S-box-containing protein
MYLSVDAQTAAILNCNQKAADELGYTKEEIIGRPVFDLYTPDSAEYAKKRRCFRALCRPEQYKGTNCRRNERTAG